MSKQWDDLIRLIRRQVGACDAEADDATLLTRFAESRDEAAFEQLLRRYGPMVYAVCRRNLPTAADAEDAFQATFLALVGSVKKVRQRGAVGGWLYQVALQTASELLRKKRRQLLREERVARPEAVANQDPVTEELLAALDQEVAELPDRYRQAIVHCRILNKPLAEVAGVLGLSAVAVWKRLRRAEDILRQRMQQRGLAIPSAGLGFLLAVSPASALSPEVVRGALRSIIGASHIAVPPTSTHTPGWWGHAVVVLVFAATMCGVAALFVATREPPPTLVAPVANETVTRPVADVAPQLPERPWAVLAGRVVDNAGRPVSRARLAVLGRSWDQRGPGLRDQLLANCVTGADGRFHMPVVTPLRGESDAVWLVTSDPTGGGWTVATIPIAGGVVPADIPIRLTANRLTGRVVGPNGEPLSGASVRIIRFGGAAFEPTRPEHEPLPSDVWPQPVTTGSDGQFVFPNLDSSVGVLLSVKHWPSGSSTTHEIETGTGANPNIEIRLPRVRQLVGRVTAADTGKPLAKAQVVVAFNKGNESRPVVQAVQTGVDGRYAITVPVAPRWSIQVTAGPPVPYLLVRRSITPSADDEPVVADVALPRGVLTSGRVTDSETGQPIRLAKVQFHTSKPLNEAAGLSPGTTTGTDGEFQLAVPSTSGLLTFTAPDLAYLPVKVDPGALRGRPGVFHAVVRFSGQELTNVAVRMERGRTIQGLATLPDGSPVTDGWVWCYHLVGGRDLQTLRPLAIRDGRFAVPGCQPRRTYTIVLADREFRNGIVARATWSETPIDVRLEQVGSITVEAKAGPSNMAAGTILSAELCLPSDVAEGDGTAGEGPSTRWLPLALSGAVIGPDGVTNLVGLIPGVNYRLSPGRGMNGYSKLVTVSPGGHGKVTLEMPESAKE